MLDGVDAGLMGANGRATSSSRVDADAELRLRALDPSRGGALRYVQLSSREIQFEQGGPFSSHCVIATVSLARENPRPSGWMPFVLGGEGVEGELSCPSG